ncbi:hypothetical protein AAWM_08620 [Aspergillus awamori]|uniref:Uncharacterized protein n=1 Tax=Aspergillus awamori TaxID=105351 RepID=A0A401L2J3_ASPAW|nr:hypothetical protein AAWM_08620 [Aspergillus awamori]
MASQKVIQVLLAVAAVGLTFAAPVSQSQKRSCSYTVNSYDCYTDGDSTTYRELTTTQLDHMISEIDEMLRRAILISTLDDDYIGTCVTETTTAVFDDLVSRCGRSGGWLDITFSNGAEWLYEEYATTGTDTACSDGGECITVVCSAFDDCVF